MTETNMAPKVEEATIDDLEDIVKINITTWNSEFFESIFPTNPEGVDWYRRNYGGWLTKPKREGTPDGKVLIVRDEQGQAVSVAVYWFVRPGDDFGGDSYGNRWLPNHDVPGADQKKLDDFFKTMAKEHTHIMGDKPHVFLEALMTRPEARKRGYGSALVRRGGELADELGWECYLDAAREQAHVYRAQGYVDQSVAPDAETIPMVRPRKS